MKPLDPTPARRHILRHGSVHYELLERLGGGGMGDVHAARVVGGLERRVCVKRIAGALGAAHASSLRAEARLLASVRHANVVSLLAFAEDEEAGPFLVLELVEGADLKTLCRRLAPDRLADAVAAHVACALLRALAAVQRCIPGLVHQDVTPHNVLVSVHGEVKLSDFGIALVRDCTRWTRPSFVRGKPGYMAPEQLVGDEVDPRSDLFGVGVVLYELLAGARPWPHGDTLAETVHAVHDDPVPLLHWRPTLDPALARVVDRLVAPVPAQRFVRAEEALRALAPFGAGELGSLRLASLVAAITRRVT